MHGINLVFYCKMVLISVNLAEWLKIATTTTKGYFSTNRLKQIHLRAFFVQYAVPLRMSSALDPDVLAMDHMKSLWEAGERPCQQSASIDLHFA